MPSSSGHRKGDVSESSSQGRKGNSSGPPSEQPLVLPTRLRSGMKSSESGSRSTSRPAPGSSSRSSSTNRQTGTDQGTQTVLSYPPNVPCPPTILESFDCPLPRYAIEHSTNAQDLQLSGQSTKETDAPKFWCISNQKSFVEKGANTLHDHSRSLQDLNREFICNTDRVAN